jgi:hypothetical protein
MTLRDIVRTGLCDEALLSQTHTASCALGREERIGVGLSLTHAHLLAHFLFKQLSAFFKLFTDSNTY